ncbi:PAS domain-containing sensor histidine kinase [Maridesulfovibrio sp. FT414]|uniref:PAS domain-containing sensor histidine kinase n=1 Tax=Maridesulfovibrio sp. FT414 TaxID=2979469 RepID=UPI003D8026F2
MSVFARDILQSVEFMAQDYPGVVVALDDDRRVVFVGGDCVRVLSGLISPGDFLDSCGIDDREGLAGFVDAVGGSESNYPGYYESRIEGKGEILWHGSGLESGFVVLKGRLVGTGGSTFYEPENELDSLRDKERILSTLLGNLPGMVYRCRNDVDWTMEFVSAGCFELTGYTASSLLGNRDVSFADLILPEYRAHVWECVQEAVQERQLYEVIYKILTASGDTKWVWEKGTDVQEGGELIALEGFITDITPLMETEQELHQSEERFRLMAEKTGQMVYDVDLETGKITWSGAVRDISGAAEKEFQSVDLKGWEAHIHPDDRAKVMADFEASVNHAQPFVSVYRFRQKNGSYLYVEDEGDFVLNAGGEPIRMVGTIKNYTDRIKVQELMIQSEKMTTVASLSAGMAHEINNPLGVISQSAQNIERRLSPQLSGNIEVAESLGISLELVNRYLDERKISTMLEAIKNASSRAARIIVRMLDFSRKSVESKEFCNLETLLDRAVEMAESESASDCTADFRKIRIVREIAPDLPEIICFPGEMEQVLFNLLRNSAQAMLEAEAGVDPVITIRISFNNAYVTLEVEDNGPGMDEHTRKKIFEPFFSTRAHGEGGGLGLSIVYFIVTRNHGGSIRVESEPGHGVKFVISLPRGAAGSLYSKGTAS